MNGEMEFVLYCSEEGLGRLGILAGVHRRGIDVGDFLIKLPLTCPDFTDFRQQVLKILLAKKCPTLKPLFIQHIAANGIVAQHTRGPLAKLNGTSRVHPETDSDDGVEVVEPRRVILAIPGSMSEISRHTAFSLSSPVSKIFLRCSVMVLRPLSKRVLINFCVSQTVSSATRTSMPSSPACRVKTRNSTVLLRI